MGMLHFLMLRTPRIRAPSASTNEETLPAFSKTAARLERRVDLSSSALAYDDALNTHSLPLHNSAGSIGQGVRACRRHGPTKSPAQLILCRVTQQTAES